MHSPLFDEPDNFQPGKPTSFHYNTHINVFVFIIINLSCISCFMCIWFPHLHLPHRVETSHTSHFRHLWYFSDIMSKMAVLKIFRNSFSINSLCLGSWYMEQINTITLNMISKAITITPLPLFHHLGATQPSALHHGAVFVS